MENRNIDEIHPRFSNSDIARCFIRDGIMVSLVDSEMHEEELAWLKEVAKVNSIENMLQDDSYVVPPLRDIFDLEKI